MRHRTMVVSVMALAAALVLIPVTHTFADPIFEIPTLINYQGRLTDESGVPFTGITDITFSLYDQLVDGSCRWQETQTVEVTEGLFNVLLGSIQPLLSGHLAGERYLTMQLAGEPEMSPRQRLVSVAYALWADEANNARSLADRDAGDFVAVAGDTMTGGLTVQDDVVVYGDLGIGLTAPQYKLHVLSGDNYTAQIGNNATGGHGLSVSASAQSGSTCGIDAYAASPDGIAIYAYNESEFGDGYGVYAESVGPEGIAIRGEAPSQMEYSTGIGVYGRSRGDHGGVGVRGEWDGAGGTGHGGHFTTTSPSGTGIKAEAITGDHGGVGVKGVCMGDTSHCAGVWGQTNSANGIGVYGYASNTNGETYAVSGKTDSWAGYGVYGENTAGDELSYAVYGRSDAIDGYGTGVVGFGGRTGVRGFVIASGDSDYNGVVGSVFSGSGTNCGVYGSASGGAVNWAGYFEGNVYVGGTVTEGGALSKIDHPLDPENKYLNHSFIESPDMMNVYNGNIELDASGAATVTLPDYFDALNDDFRYQLTCIGGFAPVYVAEEISGNRFTIAGGEPGMKVSWQVTGIRRDAWAKANRTPVVEEKSESEQGLYLHPEAFGKSTEYRVNAKRNAALQQEIGQLKTEKPEAAHGRSQ